MNQRLLGEIRLRQVCTKCMVPATCAPVTVARDEAWAAPGQAESVGCRWQHQIPWPSPCTFHHPRLYSGGRKTLT